METAHTWESECLPKPPSRQRYEREHPTVSFRLDRQTYGRLKSHLDGTKCSFADFVKDALGREESTIEKRILAHETGQLKAFEDRLRCLEDLVNQVLCELLVVNSGSAVWNPCCPRCGEDLWLSNAKEIGRGSVEPTVCTFACACGYFTNTYNRIDLTTIRQPGFDDGGDEEDS